MPTVFLERDTKESPKLANEVYTTVINPNISFQVVIKSRISEFTKLNKESN